ncbi:hypothetical protein [Auritidibacter ignavus]|uniref:hypothetical protein n=1 Tax=Auritidibacter ignavus TaxID=678932 RepID=UPI00244D3B52|nr:hypothetical protein [Auritidibacter ignavus]WGH84131.1 hypothetical protein QDX20_00835 [Auritidibacter ignavus]
MNSQSSSVVRAVLIDTRARTIEESAVPGKWKPNTKVAEFGGLALTGKQLCRGEFGFAHPENLTIADLRDAPGEWLAIASSRHLLSGVKHLVFADRFGFGPVFYAIIPRRGVVLSDSFIAVAVALRESGVSVHLNLSTYVAALTSRGRTAEGMSDSTTMAEQIHILEPDCVLEITGRQATIRPRVTLGGSETINDYTDAVSLGIELARESLTTAVNSLSAQKVITLSGGVDSRLALALLTLTGAHRDFKVLTFDPRRYEGKKRKVYRRDIQLANAIRADHGMEWWGPTEQCGLSLLFSERVFTHQIRDSNRNYEMFLSDFSGEYAIPQMTIRGGGGELLRVPGSAEGLANRVFRELGKGVSMSDPRVFNFFLQAHSYPRLANKHFKPLVAEHFERTFKRSRGSDLFQRLDGYYFRTRNRYHFGITRQALDKREVPLFPLANPYFLQASRLAEFHERTQGKLVKDIFQASAPQLLKYPFDSDQWTSRLTTAELKKVPDDDSWRESYDVADSGKTVQIRRDEADAQRFPFNAQRAGDLFIREGFATIVGHAPEQFQEPLQQQHEAVLRTMEQGVLNRSTILGKVASALDVVTPPPPEIASLKTLSVPGLSADETAPRTKVRLITDLRESSAALSYPDPTSSVTTVQRIHGRILVANDFSSVEPSEYEWAFYLYRDGTEISEVWYQDTPRYAFTGVEESGRYTVLTFIRRKDSPQNVIKVPSTSAISI